MREVIWKIGDEIVDLSRHGMIMGVLNVTPDSFSDRGDFFSVEAAVARGQQIVAEGAQILDVGGESTRPGSDPVSTDEELRRVIPVIEQLRDKIRAISERPHLNPLPEGEEDIGRGCLGNQGRRPYAQAPGEGCKFISIDTSKYEVAKAALDGGATIVNDVTGGRGDARMMELVAKKNAGFIIMHMQGQPKTMQIAPHYIDVVEEVANFFRQQYGRAISCDIDPMAIAFDPGIGFGKTLEHNLELLENLQQLQVEGRPIVVGVSRKRFLGKLIGAAKAQDLLAPTVAMTALLRQLGARILRVHDVKENVDALRVTEALLEH